MRQFLIILLILKLAFPSSAQIANDTTYVYRGLASAMESPDKVFRLNLSKKQYTEFPMDVFKFKNLEELDLSKNRISEVPKEIGTLKNLKKLNLSYNKLDSLPPEIGLLTSLVYLGLNRNKLEVLPS